MVCVYKFFDYVINKIEVMCRIFVWLEMCKICWENVEDVIFLWKVIKFGIFFSDIEKFM